MQDNNVKSERSNAGVLALADGVLSGVFGLTSSLTQQIFDKIESSGEMPALRQSIKLLPLSSHTRLNQIVDAAMVNGTEDKPFDDEDLDDGQADAPSTDDTVDMGPSDSDDIDMGNIGDSDDMLDSMGVNPSDLRNNADEDDYSAESRKDRFKSESTSSFKAFRENATVNAKLNSQISADMDDGIDENTLKRIKQLEARGQTDAAKQLRAQSSRKQQSQQGSMRPTQRRILAKKKELARAIQADKDAQERNGGM